MRKEILIGVIAGIAGILLVFLARPAPERGRRIEPAYPLVDMSSPKLAGMEVPVPNRAAPPQWRIPNLDVIVEEVNFERVPLGQALDWIARKAEANIVVQWRFLENGGVYPENEVSLRVKQLPLHRVLDLILDQTGWAGFHVDRGVILITTPELLESRLDLRVYDVSDIILNTARMWQLALSSLGEPSQSLDSWEMETARSIVGSVKMGVAPATWMDNSGRAHVSYWTGKLIVLQSRKLQEEVQSVLYKLRHPEKR